jgi:hypothetical protein
VEARAGAELRSPLDPLSGLPGFQEQLTVADASAHDAATATWEGLPHELRERAVLDWVTLASSAAKVSDLDRGGGALRRSGRSAAPASSGSLRARAARERRWGVLQRRARRSSGIPVLRPFYWLVAGVKP